MVKESDRDEPQLAVVPAIVLNGQHLTFEDITRTSHVQPSLMKGCIALPRVELEYLGSRLLHQSHFVLAARNDLGRRFLVMAPKRAFPKTRTRARSD